MADSSPMMLQYERIKAAHSDAILFFRLGDFYEMFRQDALEASKILGLTLTQRNGVPMCGVPHHASRSYIARLLQHGKKVAVCEQVKLEAKGLAEREVIEIISPGMLLDEEYLEQGSNNFILSIARSRGEEFCCALFDVSTGELSVQAFGPEELRGEIETLIEKWGPREFVVQESILSETQALRDLVRDHPEILANRFGDWQYDITSTEGRLCRIMGTLNLKSFGLDPGDPLLAPVGAVLDYAERAARHSMDHVRSIRVIRSADFMRLDETTVKNLELVRNLRDSSYNFTLLSILDHTKSPMGSRLLRKVLVEPLLQKSAIEERLNRVAGLYHDQRLLGKIRDHLAKTGDVERLANRILLDKAHAKDLVSLAASLLEMTRTRELFIGSEEEGKGLFSGFDIDGIEKAGNLIRRAIADEPSLLLSEGNLIRDGFDERVDEYRRLRKDSASVLEDYVEEERKAHGISSLRVRNNNIIGYYLELSKSNSQSAPAHFIRKQSLVNGERYTTERLIRLEEEIGRAQELCVERERALFIEIRDSLKGTAKSMADFAGRVAFVDVMAAFAYAATVHGYTKPILVEECLLDIQGGRHPVVEAHAGQGSFVPNDLRLGGEEKTALISGPNMAGKSTFLRQNALIVLMAHIGCFVPADSATIGLVDKIFCRVGASDNLARGESTFLVEMNETAYILRSAGERSLVIMDEVGRGTSTQDGLAIARGILEYLVDELRSLVLFATHFHELTEIESKRIRNLSMAVEDRDGKVTFLRRVREGASGNSYGVHVAEMAGLPRQVVARAREILAVPGGNVPQTLREPVASAQNELFVPLDLVLSEIVNFRVEDTTPLEALYRISAWKRIIEAETGRRP